MKIKALSGTLLAYPKNWLAITCASLLFLGCGEAEDSIESNNEADSTFVENPVDPEEEEVVAENALPQVSIPEGYEIMSEVIGDLDGDGIAEKAIVFNTDRDGEMGTERELCIYVEHEGLWSLWHTAIGPVLSSERGGVLGDPFDEISIRNGMITISHFGGSTDRWSYTHSYKYTSEDWYLVKANIINYSICDYSETFTYDLVALSGYHSRQKDECDVNGSVISSEMEIEETLVLSSKQDQPLMDGFLPGDVAVDVEGDADGYRY